MSVDRQVGLARRLWPAAAIAVAGGGAFLVLDRPTPLPAASVASSPSSATTQPAADNGTTDNGTTDNGTTDNDATDDTADDDTTGDGEVDPAATPTVPPASSTCVGIVREGTDAETRFGIVRVQATVTAAGTLCNIDAIETPSENRRSVRINELAVPVLHERATAAQAATFQAVSGATVTTDGYKQSLQSILDHPNG